MSLKKVGLGPLPVIGHRGAVPKREEAAIPLMDPLAVAGLVNEPAVHWQTALFNAVNNGTSENKTVHSLMSNVNINTNETVSSSLNTPTMEFEVPDFSAVATATPAFSAVEAAKLPLSTSSIIVTGTHEEVIGEMMLPVVNSNCDAVAVPTAPHAASSVLAPPLTFNERIEDMWGDLDTSVHAPAALVEGKQGAEINHGISSLWASDKTELKTIDLGATASILPRLTSTPSLKNEEGLEDNLLLDTDTYQHVLDTLGNGDWDSMWATNTASPATSTVVEQASADLDNAFIVAPASDVPTTTNVDNMSTVAPSAEAAPMVWLPTTLLEAETAKANVKEELKLENVAEVPATVITTTATCDPVESAFEEVVDLQQLDLAAAASFGPIEEEEEPSTRPRKRGRPSLPFNRVIPPKVPRVSSASRSAADATTSDDGLTDEARNTMRYNRMRALNNEASKRCRAKRKEKVSAIEQELQVETVRNAELKARFAAMEAKVTKLKKAMHIVLSNGPGAKDLAAEMMVELA